VTVGGRACKDIKNILLDDDVLEAGKIFFITQSLFIHSESTGITVDYSNAGDTCKTGVAITAAVMLLSLAI